MKKYKLVKWYPSMYLTETGFVVKQKEENGDYYPTEKCDRNIFKACEIENNPEFWEEIVEKDYEILSFKAGNIIFKKTEFNKWRKYGTKEIYPNLEVGGYYAKTPLEIYSIKKLSDGEVFTVGDKVTETVTGTCNGWEISEFSLKDTRCFTAGVNINNIEKVKQKLFTTEDGFDIFEGDIAYSVKLKDFSLYSDGLYKSFYMRGFKPIKGFKYFSTRESAEEYILMNKPFLSINDVKDSYSGLYSIYKDHTIYKLTKLVKSRLND